MDVSFSVSRFLRLFPNNESCLEEIKQLRYPYGTKCVSCKKVTRYYKLKNRPAYSCKFCRHQICPLAGTIFEKTTTPLRLWFLAMFLMTHTKARISRRQLQKELGVTYKTAWRMYALIHRLMTQGNRNLLLGSIEFEKEEEKVYKWTIFNKFIISVVQKDEATPVNELDKNTDKKI